MSKGTDGGSTAGGVPIERLIQELNGDETDGEVTADGESSVFGPADREPAEEALATTMNTLFPHTDFRFDEERVKTVLEDLLVVLVALREDEAHGKRLMGDLARMFDARLSPGTVYPKLHDLEEEGVLSGHEKVHTRDYLIDDREAARERIEATMQQYLALSFFLYVALEKF